MSLLEQLLGLASPPVAITFVDDVPAEPTIHTVGRQAERPVRR